MRRRAHAVVLTSPLLALAACRQPAPVPDLSQHNLLLVTIDTLRADRVGAYGSERRQTPNLDALARGGVRFADAYTSVPLTLPAHAALFTGKQPFALGVRINGVGRLAPGEITLAERFRDAGYATGAVVAAYVVIAKFGLDQGFARYDDALGPGDVFRFYSEIPAEEVRRRFSRWLDGVREGRFFAWVHFYDPHQPYDPPPAWAERFPGDPYGGEIAYVDAQIGELLADLERRKLLTRTAVVVTSDHGEGFGEHGEEGHGLLCYEETLRVPLLVSAPGRLPAGVVQDPARLVDLAPTLLELFRLETPAGMQGRSLARRLAGGGDAESPPVYFETLAGYEGKNWAPLHGVVDGGFKLVAAPEPELYDLRLDPGETRNLAAADRGRRRRLGDLLESILSSSPAPEAAGETPTAEDRRHLRALGYLGAGAPSSLPRLDPKRGIRLEQAVRVARTHLRRGDTARARAELEALVAANREVDLPDFYELRHELAAAAGDEEAAIAELEHGIARFPGLEGPRLRLATYLYEIGRLDAAEARARALQAEDPRLAQATTLRGLVAERRGDLAAAAAHFSAALALEPGSVPLRLRLADLRAREGDAEGAAELYGAVLDAGLADRDAAVLFRAAALFGRLGRLARAEQLFRQGLALEAGGVHHLGLALVLARQGRTAEAVAHLESALAAEREPLPPEQRALALAALRQWR
jgi:arylsulfatase A-like enzyme/tetratricopeptide (TPR) repeat protein